MNYVSFWNVPIEEVPGKTGVDGLMDLPDIREVLDFFEIDLINKKVVDVGCGTGRLAKLCGDYYGYDIAPSMVAYAKQQGVKAALVDDLADCQGADIVCCLSVFTHISREDRQAYLGRFAQIAPHALMDILPGREGGDPGAWYADIGDFETDLAQAGFSEVEHYERRASSGYLHRYYHT